MKFSVFTWVAGVSLVGGLAGVPNTVNAEPQFKMEARERGHCKLTNVDEGREIFNGTCVIKQTKDQRTNLFEIRMRGHKPLLFASTEGGTWMHGPETVRFRDRGHTAIFRWANFRLEVDDD